MIDQPKKTTQVAKRTQVERRAAAERRLFVAGVRLASEKGFDGFSLAELGELAGFSRGLPAHYFGSKDNFQKQLVKFIIAEFNNNQEIPEPKKDLSSLVKTIEKAFDISDEDMIYSRILLIILSDTSGKFLAFEELEAFCNRTIDNIENDLRQGMSDGYIRKDIDPKLISRILIKTICTVIQMALSDDQIEPKKTGQELIKLILNGIEAV